MKRHYSLLIAIMLFFSVFTSFVHGAGLKNPSHSQFLEKHELVGLEKNEVSSPNAVGNFSYTVKTKKATCAGKGEVSIKMKADAGTEITVSVIRKLDGNAKNPKTIIATGGQDIVVFNTLADGEYEISFFIKRGAQEETVNGNFTIESDREEVEIKNVYIGIGVYICPEPGRRFLIRISKGEMKEFSVYELKNGKKEGNQIIPWTASHPEEQEFVLSKTQIDNVSSGIIRIKAKDECGAQNYYDLNIQDAKVTWELETEIDDRYADLDVGCGVKAKLNTRLEFNAYNAAMPGVMNVSDMAPFVVDRATYMIEVSLNGTLIEVIPNNRISAEVDYRRKIDFKTDFNLPGKLKKGDVISYKVNVNLCGKIYSASSEFRVNKPRIQLNCWGNEEQVNPTFYFSGQGNNQNIYRYNFSVVKLKGLEFIKYPSGFRPSDLWTNYFSGNSYQATNLGNSDVLSFFYEKLNKEMSKPLPEGDYEVEIKVCDDEIIKIPFTVRYGYTHTIDPEAYIFEECQGDRSVSITQDYSSADDNKYGKEYIYKVELLEAPESYKKKNNIKKLPYNLSRGQNELFTLNNIDRREGGKFKFKAYGKDFIKGKGCSQIKHKKGEKEIEVIVPKHVETNPFNLEIDRRCGTADISYEFVQIKDRYITDELPILLRWDESEQNYLKDSSLEAGDAIRTTRQENGKTIVKLLHKNVEVRGKQKFRFASIPESLSQTGYYREYYNKCFRYGKEFTVTTKEVNLRAFYVFECSDGSKILKINVDGVPDFTYQIVQKNGVKVNMPIQNEPVFTDLEKGLYKIKVQSSCAEAYLDVSTENNVLPEIKLDYVCESKNLTLKVKDGEYFDIEWFKGNNGNLSTTGKKGETFKIENYNANKDGKVYTAKLKYKKAGQNSCLEQDVSIDLSKVKESNRVGEGEERYFKTLEAQNLGSVDLFTLLKGNNIKKGTWTTPLDKDKASLNGSIVNLKTLGIGRHEFNFETGYVCLGNNIARVVIHIADTGIALTKHVIDDNRRIVNCGNKLKVGDKYFYRFEIKNKSSVKIENVVIEDKTINFSKTVDYVYANSSKTIETEKFTITNADIQRGEIRNIATVTVDTPFGKLKDTSGTDFNNDEPTVIDFSTKTPTFDAIAPICYGDTAPSLPRTSKNGIKGGWSPYRINTYTEGETIYTFIPNSDECAKEVTMKVVIKPKKTPTFTQIASICYGGNFTLPTTSNNGIKGTWEPAVNNKKTRTYTFTPNSNECAKEVTMRVTVNPKPIADAGEDQIVDCNTPKVTLGTPAQTGYTYKWTPTKGLDNATKAQPVATPTKTTQYTLVVTAKGCKSKPSKVTVTVDKNKPKLTLTSSATELNCTTTSITLTAGGANTYVWKKGGNVLSGQTGATLNVTEAGEYSVVGTGANGCTATKSVTITKNTTLPNAGENSVLYTCGNTPTEQQMFDALLGNPETGGVWQAIGDPVATSKYSYTVTKNGCSDVSELYINEDVAPGVNLKYCGDDLDIYSHNRFYFDQEPAEGSIWELFYGTSIIDENGEIEIRKCNDGVFDLSVIYTSSKATFVWSIDSPDNGSFSSTTDRNVTVTVPLGKTAVVSVAVSEMFCSRTIQFKLANVNIKPGVISSSGVSCGGDVPTIQSTTDAEISADKLKYTWEKSEDNGATWTVINGATSKAYTPPSPLTKVTKYRRLVSSSNNICSQDCKAESNEVTITPSPVPSLTLTSSATKLTCSRPNITLTASGNGTYEWKKNGNTLSGHTATTFNATEPGTYSVILTSASGCTATKSVVITKDITVPSLTLKSSATELTCSVKSITLTALL